MTRTEDFQGHPSERSWIPAGGLPDDAVIVVRTAALDDLKARVREPSSVDEGKTAVTDKQIGTRERTTLLTIIGALASLAKIDLAHSSKGAMSIQAEADRLGVKVGLRTIEGHLKRVPEAMDRRR